jgi:uncharacterized protein
MRFTWDGNKQESNWAKHGFDFADAERVFKGATFTFEDDRYAYAEQRFVTLGLLNGVVVVIAHTEQGSEIRIISMRGATKHEQLIFFRNL